MIKPGMRYVKCEMESFSVEKCIFLGENTIFVGTIPCCNNFHHVICVVIDKFFLNCQLVSVICLY